MKVSLRDSDTPVCLRVCVCVTAEAAAGSMMDEEPGRDGAGDVHVSACERVNPSPAKKQDAEHPSKTSEIPHSTTILAH